MRARGHLVVVGGVAAVSLVLVVLFLLSLGSTVRGKVTDSYTGAPIPGVALSSGGGSTTTNNQGQFALDRIGQGDVLLFQAQGYDPLKLAYTGGNPLPVALRPNTLFGEIRDAETKKPVAKATVNLAERVVKTADDGSFYLTEVPADAQLLVSAAGYRTARLDIPLSTRAEIALKPLVVKAVYLPFYAVGWDERREHIIDLIAKTELNAVVMDVKGDRGLVNAGVGVPLSASIGADIVLVNDLPAILARLKEKGVYTIARIVVFKDTKLAQGRPDLAVRDERGIYVDCEEQLWVDHFSPEVWDYNISIAQRSIAIGFDEVQFDYVRFPSDCMRGRLIYSQESTEQTRTAAIAGFLGRARAALRPLGGVIAADTFGWTAVREDDMGIGQLLESIAPEVDYFSPMAYPSTWGPGSLKLDYPAATPYEIILKSLSQAEERLKAIPGVKLRPWLQDFNDYGPRRLTYGPQQVLLQRQAAVAAGSHGWMLWNPAGIYNEGALGPP